MKCSLRAEAQKEYEPPGPGGSYSFPLSAGSARGLHFIKEPLYEM